MNVREHTASIFHFNPKIRAEDISKMSVDYPSSNLHDDTFRETETPIFTAVIIWEKQIEVIREQTAEGNDLV